MSPQTETKASVGFKVGVKDYKLTYYTPDYVPKDNDMLAAFRVTLLVPIDSRREETLHLGINTTKTLLYLEIAPSLIGIETNRNGWDNKHPSHSFT